MTPEQAHEWRGVVNRLPAGWFPQETLPMLAQYCRQVVRARRLALLLDRIEKQDTLDVKEYRDLLRSEQETSRTIATLATKMRITQQSSYDKSKKRGPVMKKRPWE